jgi:sugar phosphate isomerase/epimerase
MSAEERLYVSTACLRGDKSHARIVEALMGQGIRRIEFSGVHPHLEPARLSALVRKYIDQGVSFIYHNYFPTPKEDIVLNYLSRDPQTKRQAAALISSAIALAKDTGVSLYAFHPGYYRDAVCKNGMFEFAQQPRLDARAAMKMYKDEFPKFYHSLNIDGADQRLFLGLENLFPNPDGQSDSFMCTFEEIDELFQSDGFRGSNIGLLIDLGHLTIAANLLGFDRDQALDRILEKYADIIYEVHLSENDGKEDLHERCRQGSWQMKALKRFDGAGSRVGGTRFCIESRGMTAEEIAQDYAMVLSELR